MFLTRREADRFQLGFGSFCPERARCACGPGTPTALGRARWPGALLPGAHLRVIEQHRGVSEPAEEADALPAATAAHHHVGPLDEVEDDPASLVVAHVDSYGALVAVNGEENGLSRPSRSRMDVRVMSPVPGRSIFITSAPKSPSIWVALGRVGASGRLRSTTSMSTFTPSAAPNSAAIASTSSAPAVTTSPKSWKAARRSTATTSAPLHHDPRGECLNCFARVTL